jgi:hypothetical protein
MEALERAIHRLGTLRANRWGSPLTYDVYDITGRLIRADISVKRTAELLNVLPEEVGDRRGRAV